MSEEIEPPESDEIFDNNEDRDQLVETAVQQAQQYHRVMDAAKDWARETATELRVEAALEEDDETAEEIEQIAAMVLTVPNRIERGDNNLSRQA